MPAPSHHRNAIAKVEVAGRMGDDDDCAVTVRQGAKELHHPCLERRVEPRRRLVEAEQAGPDEKLHGYARPLALSAG